MRGPQNPRDQNFNLEKQEAHSRGVTSVFDIFEISHARCSCVRGRKTRSSFRQETLEEKLSVNQCALFFLCFRSCSVLVHREHTDETTSSRVDVKFRALKITPVCLRFFAVFLVRIRGDIAKITQNSRFLPYQCVCFFFFFWPAAKSGDLACGLEMG